MKEKVQKRVNNKWQGKHSATEQQTVKYVKFDSFYQVN